MSASNPLQHFIDTLPGQTHLCDLPELADIDYRGYRELLQRWAVLPNARTSRIGSSRDGEPLWMVEIGNPDATRVTVVLAGIHPIEWIGTETALQIAKEQALDPCPDRRVCFFPLANPDGFLKVEKSLRAGKRKWVRTNSAGVNLNRNWPTHFKATKADLQGRRSSGKAPLSEPEIAAIVGKLDEIAAGASIDFALSLHSIGKMILLPWGGISRRPDSYRRHYSAARAIRKRLGGYSIRQVSKWVPGISYAHGMDIDHLHAAYGATSLLIECTLGQLSLRKPSVLLSPFKIFNPSNGRQAGARIARALDPFVRGLL